MKTFLLLLSSILAFGQASQSSLPPRVAPATINYYISTGGSNSNPCTSASKCLTLAHVLALIPRVLDNNYIVNVADGTYAEAIDTSGFMGGSGPLVPQGIGPSLKILGNTTTPANVVFSGTTTKCESASSGACIVGSAKILLAGLTITNAARVGVTCADGQVDYNKVVITMTGAASTESVGISHLHCEWSVSGNLTVSGFDTDASPTGGLGIYNAHGTAGILYAGDITITGPAAGADYHGTVGFVIEYAPSGFTIVGLTSNVTISGVQTGILVNDNGAFSSYVSSGTLSITNAATPTGSAGISTAGGGAVNMVTTALTVGHFTNCLSATSNSVIDQGGGSRSLTNCTASSTSSGGQIVLF